METIYFDVTEATEGRQTTTTRMTGYFIAWAVDDQVLNYDRKFKLFLMAI